MERRKRVDEKIDESVIRWFGHIKRIRNDRMVKSVYVNERMGGRLVGGPRKRWIDTENDSWKEKIFKYWESKEKGAWWK